MEAWRLTAVEAAMAAFSRPVIDGTKAGEDWIEEQVIDPVWDHRDLKEYHDGDHAWCGDFYHWCLKQGGFRVPCKMASPGRILYPYASYYEEGTGSLPYCTVLGPTGKTVAAKVKDLHEEVGALRTKHLLLEDGTFEGLVGPPRIMDCFFWQNKKGSWGGHVMAVLAAGNGNLSVIDGNGGLSYGPRSADKKGKFMYRRRDGVGQRTYDLSLLGKQRKPYWLVRPSRYDFDPSVLSYHKTLEQAQAKANSA